MYICTSCGPANFKNMASVFLAHARAINVFPMFVLFEFVKLDFYSKSKEPECVSMLMSRTEGRWISVRDTRITPVPGGPYNSTPLGAVIPMLLNNSDLVMGNTTKKREKREDKV